jgi:hypothetical protein
LKGKNTLAYFVAPSVTRKKLDSINTGVNAITFYFFIIDGVA